MISEQRFSKFRSRGETIGKIVLFFTVLLAFFLRVWRMNDLPHGFNADEAAIGYNVYSLLQTGEDEYGNSWPLHFRSFADYKPGGYFYLALPFVRFLGLTELAVRLPSLIAGVLSVYLIFLLAGELTPDQKRRSFGLMAAFLLAISPWHIQFSRAAWETNVATCFLICGAWLFLKGTRKHRFGFLIGSLLSLVASTYIYHSARIMAPWLLLVLIWLNKKAFFSFGKKNLLFLVIGGLVSLPLLLSLVRGGAMARFSGVGIMGDLGPFWSTNRLRGEHGSQINSWWVRLLHNRPLAYGVKVVQNWASHFSGDFLFVEGDRIRRSQCPGLGQFYYGDLFLVIAGLFFTAKTGSRNLTFPLLWLLAAPLPAALTLQSPHALRSHSMIIPLLLVAAEGVCRMFNFLKKKKLFFILGLGMIVLAYSWQLGFFLNQYLVHYPYREPQVWEGGFRELIEYLGPIYQRYQRIYVTDHYDQPYILFLFYLKYPPEMFQQEAELTPRDKFHFSTVRDFANFHFEAINWENLKKKKDILIVGTDEEIPDTAKIIKRIYFKNGRPAFEIAEL
ncbi:MAG: glycosyltransferase family 39 protein [Candidatus Pacebacteria bacterium]|nr:glycosyltransferase family 39 protein [Candidatus Paceibacterota bacterium]